jgi:hypothetical protein
VLGTIGLVLVTGHYSLGERFGFDDEGPSTPTSWAGPVAFLCLGLFLAFLGMVLWRLGEDAESFAEPV